MLSQAGLSLTERFLPETERFFELRFNNIRIYTSMLKITMLQTFYTFQLQFSKLYTIHCSSSASSELQLLIVRAI